MSECEHGKGVSERCFKRGDDIGHTVDLPAAPCSAQRLSDLIESAKRYHQAAVRCHEKDWDALDIKTMRQAELVLAARNYGKAVEEEQNAEVCPAQTTKKETIMGNNNEQPSGSPSAAVDPSHGQGVAKFRCNACGGICERDLGWKVWTPSFCEKKGKNARLYRISAPGRISSTRRRKI